MYKELHNFVFLWVLKLLVHLSPEVMVWKQGFEWNKMYLRRMKKTAQKGLIFSYSSPNYTLDSEIKKSKMEWE